MTSFDLEVAMSFKILEVDFSTKQVRLDQFVQLAQTMQLHLSAPIRSKSTVKQKMTLVTQTWQDLLNRSVSETNTQNKVVLVEEIQFESIFVCAESGTGLCWRRLL